MTTRAEWTHPEDQSDDPNKLFYEISRMGPAGRFNAISVYDATFNVTIAEMIDNRSTWEAGATDPLSAWTSG